MLNSPREPAAPTRTPRDRQAAVAISHTYRSRPGIKCRSRRMAAKDWFPLREALWKHVREPLQRRHPTVWNEAMLGQPIERKRLQALASGGKISAMHDAQTVLWYTLAYSCLHFDALDTLISKHGIRKSMLSLLAQRSPSWLSPRLLHVDFGCGPGTASWAIIKAFSDSASVISIGYDHNRHMIKLANQVTPAIARSWAGTECRFFPCQNRFLKECMSRAPTCDGVLITINSVFGQPFMNDETIDDLCQTIRDVRVRLEKSPVIVIGTHPPYSPDRVRSAWNRVAHALSGTLLFERQIAVESWNPICHGQYGASDNSAWSRWSGKPQFAHVIKA